MLGWAIGVRCDTHPDVGKVIDPSTFRILDYLTSEISMGCKLSPCVGEDEL